MITLRELLCQLNELPDYCLDKPVHATFGESFSGSITGVTHLESALVRPKAERGAEYEMLDCELTQEVAAEQGFSVEDYETCALRGTVFLQGPEPAEDYIPFRSYAEGILSVDETRLKFDESS